MIHGYDELRGWDKEAMQVRISPEIPYEESEIYHKDFEQRQGYDIQFMDEWKKHLMDNDTYKFKHCPNCGEKLASIY